MEYFFESNSHFSGNYGGDITNEEGDSMLLNNLNATKNVYNNASYSNSEANNFRIVDNEDVKKPRQSEMSSAKITEIRRFEPHENFTGVKRSFFEHCTSNNAVAVDQGRRKNITPNYISSSSQSSDWPVQSISTNNNTNSNLNVPTDEILFSDELEPDHMWYIMFETLLQFCIQNNHCNVPYGFEIFLNDGVTLRLGQWLHQQRERKQQGLLAEDQLIVLQSLVDSGKLLWEYQINEADSDKYDSLWSLYFDALVSFSAEYGNCNIPKLREYKLADGTMVKLGLWLENQRKSKRNGTLPAARASRLQYLVDMGKLNWSPITELNRKSILDSGDRWMMCFEALLRYGDHHGTCNVPYKVKLRLFSIFILYTISRLITS